jgi:hypothetical protein
MSDLVHLLPLHVVYCVLLQGYTGCLSCGQGLVPCRVGVVAITVVNKQLSGAQKPRLGLIVAYLSLKLTYVGLAIILLGQRLILSDGLACLLTTVVAMHKAEVEPSVCKGDGCEGKALPGRQLSSLCRYKADALSCR